MYLHKLQILFGFHQFSHKCLLSVLESNPGCHSAFTCQVSIVSFNLWQFLLPCRSWPWYLWWILINCFIKSFYLNLSEVFLQLHWSSAFGARIAQKWYYYPIRGIWLRQWLPGSFTVNLLFLPFYSLFFGMKSLSSPPARRRD